MLYYVSNVLRKLNAELRNKMKLIEKNIDDLIPAVYNPRIISDKEFKNLKDSMEKFGLVEPIIINKNNVIIGGHQRMKAAKMIGLKKVLCVITDLNKKDEKKLNLALNKIQGDWDYDKLNKILFLFGEDLKYTGFNLNEIKGGLEIQKAFFPFNFYVKNKKDYQMLDSYFKKDGVTKLKMLVELG